MSLVVEQVIGATLDEGREAVGVAGLDIRDVAAREQGLDLPGIL